MNNNENEKINEILDDLVPEEKPETDAPEEKPGTDAPEGKPVSQAVQAEKTTGDKLMLILGGAGIVIVVAVIVFLLSFSFGNKGNKDDTTTAPQQTTAPVYDIGEGDVVKVPQVTEGITEVEDVEIDSSCRDAVKVFTDCFIYGRTESAAAMLPDAVWEDLAQSVGVSKDEFIVVMQSHFAMNSVATGIGEENILGCEVQNVLVIEEESANAIKAAISQTHGIDQSSITDVYAVSIVMQYNMEGQVVSETDELFCVKIDGVWYLAQSDSLAVYYMLTETIG